jgi:hypothetical protein
MSKKTRLISSLIFASLNPPSFAGTVLVAVRLQNADNLFYMLCANLSQT